MKISLLALLAGVALYACSENPAGPGNTYKGFTVSTDTTAYYRSSPVTLTITNNSSSIGLFRACGGNWIYMLETKTDSGWTVYSGVSCLDIYAWTIAGLPADSSHRITIPGHSLYPYVGAQLLCRFKFQFSVSPDSTLTDSLLSNVFTVR